MSDSEGTKAHKDAMDATEDYFVRAVRVIDEKFGEGYAKANPALVGEFIRACSLEYQNLR